MTDEANIHDGPGGPGQNPALYDGRADAANAHAEAVANVTAGGGWRDGISTYDIDPTTKSLLSEAEAKITGAAAAWRASQEEAQSWLANKDLHPDGRNERANSARATGREQANASLADAEAAIDVAESLLFADSAPQWSESATTRNGEMQRARDDVRMVLDGAKDPVAAAQILAGQDGHISTLMTDGNWLGLYLTSKGYAPDVQQKIINAVNVKAIHARAARGNKAAILHTKLGKMRGAIGASRSMNARDI